MSQFHTVQSVDHAGYEFFNKIGRPTKIVAPMVDQSELAYRLLCRKYGAELVFTQMIHSGSFLMSAEYRREVFTTVPSDRPLIAQFCGNDPEMILQAAKMIENSCDAIDINLGCPQGIAKRGHYGAYLMEELDLLTSIVSTLSKGLKIPVTCKTRIYTDFDRSVKLCETLVAAGASMLTIHGRTRVCKGHETGPADWDMIRRLKTHFHGRVPVIANGGIENMDDFYRCLEMTHTDGIMTSEAVLENPAFFMGTTTLNNNINNNDDTTAAVAVAVTPSQSQPQQPLPLPSPLLSLPTQLDLAEEYLSLCVLHPSPMRMIRSHVMKFLYRYFIVHTEIRENAAALTKTVEDLQDICKALRGVVTSEEHYTTTWYNRHRHLALVHAKGGYPMSRLEGGGHEMISPVWECPEDSSECGLFNGLGMFDDMSNNE